MKVWEVNGANGGGALKLSWGYDGLESDEASSEPEEVPGATTLEAVKSDLKKVAVGYQNAVIKVFDVDTGKQLMRLHSEANQGMCYYSVGVLLLIEQCQTDRPPCKSIA